MQTDDPDTGPDENRGTISAGAAPSLAAQRPPWTVLLVGQARSSPATDIAEAVLADVQFRGRPVRTVRADNAETARALIPRTPDIAVALIDIALETPDAGLDLVRHVRDIEDDGAVRILLRTGGTAGSAVPTRRIIVEYDIDGFIDDENTDQDELFARFIAGLRAYHRIRALAESQARTDETRDLLEAILNAIPAEIHVKDSGLRYRFAGRFFGEMVGMAADDIPGRTPDELFAPDRATRVKERDRAVLRSGRAQAFREIDHPAGPGRVPARTMLETKIPLFLSGADPDHVLTVALDISERLQAERDLKHLNEQLEDLVARRTAELADRGALLREVQDSMIQATIVLDQDGQVLTWNLRLLEMFDLPYAETDRCTTLPEIVRLVARRGLLGDGETEALVQDRLNRFHRDVALCRRSGLPRTASITLASGQRLEVVTTLSARGAVVITFTDVTARYMAEEKLRASEERFRAIFEQATVGIAMVLPDGRFWEANEALCQMLGYTPEELGGMTFIDITHSDDVAASVAHYEATKQQGLPGYALEKRYVRRDGTSFWALLNVAIVRDGDGSPRHTVTVIRDISDRKRAEAVLRQTKERIEEQLFQARKLEAIGTLAGGIAHDFNNILSAIVGYSEMAADSVAPDHRAQRYLANVLAACDRARAMISQILSFSRPDIDTDANRLESVELRALIHEVLDLIEPTLPVDVRLERDLGQAGLAVRADATRLHRIVMNLCRNACQAMPDGGVLRVRLESADSDAIEALASIDAERAKQRFFRLSVCDTGIGMTDTVRARIFEPFFSTKADGGGTGLGLSVVHGIVAGYGGSIDVESRVGIGTSLHVYLPVEGPIAAVGAAAPTPPPRGSGQHLLFIDDEPVLVALAREQLGALGYRVTACEDPLVAVQMVRRAPGEFHAVLTDLAMPSLSGIQLARELLGLRPGLPVILVTGQIDPSLRDRANRAGIAGLIGKPMATREVATLLAGLLSTRSAGL